MKLLFTLAFAAICGTMSANTTCIEQFNADWVNAGERYISAREACGGGPAIYAGRCNWEAAISLSNDTNNALSAYSDCIGTP